MDKEKKFENRTFSFLFFFLLLLLFESTREGIQATKEKKYSANSDKSSVLFSFIARYI